MPSTYESINSFTVSSNGTTPITFTSIPATYTDLKLIIMQQSATGNLNSYVGMQFNNDTATNYSVVRFYATGGGPGAQSSQNSSDISPGLAVWDQTSIPMLLNIDIMSYTSSAYKNVLCQLSQNKGTGSWIAQTAHTWRSTSTINEIKIFDVMGNGFGVGTSVTLYGIKAA